MAEQCIALCDYVGGIGELTFKKGERITVLAKGGDAGYWEGSINQSPGNPASEQTGSFPSCMVTSNLHPNKDPVFCDKAIALYDYLPKDNLEMTLVKGDIITILQQHSSSPGWWSGVNESELVRKGRQATIAQHFKGPSQGGSQNKREPAMPIPAGIRTSSGIQVPAGIAAEESDVKILPSNFVSSKVVMALFPFQGRHAHELSFQVRDVILLHRRWNDGWWEGTLKGKRGIFPSNYTSPNVATISPPFFCQRCKTVFAPSSWECKECARNEEITNSMLQALEDFSSGVGAGIVDAKEGGACDLFAYVDVDPSKGKGSLLTLTDTLDKNTIGPKN